MKNAIWILPATFALALLGACQQGDGPRTRQNNSTQIGSNNYGYQPATPGTATDFVTDATPTPAPMSSNATDTVATTTTTTSTNASDAASLPPMSGTTPPPSGNQQRNLPIATPVAGMPGYVTSPYQPYAGYVDVRGYPPNTEVKDPYSGKIFLVP